MTYNYKTLLCFTIVSTLLCGSDFLNISDCFGQEKKINPVLKFQGDSFAKVNPKEIWRHDSSDNIHTIAAAFSPDGKLLAYGEEDSVKIWNWKSQILTVELKLNAPVDPNSFLHSITFSPNGRYLAAGGLGDNFLRVWDMSTKKSVLTSCGSYGLWSEYDLPFSASVKEVVFTPDNRLLTIDTYSEVVRIWDILERKEIYTFYDSRRFAVSPDGSILATYNNNLILFWDLKTKKNIGKISTDDIVVFDMCFSPNGKSLAYSTKNLIIICDIQKMKETVRMENEGYVLDMQYFPGGQYLLSLINKTYFTRNTNEPWQVYIDIIDINNYEIIKRYKAETLSTKIKIGVGELIYDPRGIFLETVLSPNGQDIAIYCEGGKILLWKTPEMLLNKNPENPNLED